MLSQVWNEIEMAIPFKMLQIIPFSKHHLFFSRAIFMFSPVLNTLILKDLKTKALLLIFIYVIFSVYAGDIEVNVAM